MLSRMSAGNVHRKRCHPGGNDRAEVINARGIAAEVNDVVGRSSLPEADAGELDAVLGCERKNLDAAVLRSDMPAILGWPRKEEVNEPKPS